MPTKTVTASVTITRTTVVLLPALPDVTKKDTCTANIMQITHTTTMTRPGPRPTCPPCPSKRSNKKRSNARGRRRADPRPPEVTITRQSQLRPTSMPRPRPRSAGLAEMQAIISNSRRSNNLTRRRSGALSKPIIEPSPPVTFQASKLHNLPKFPPCPKSIKPGDPQISCQAPHATPGPASKKKRNRGKKRKRG